MRLYLCHPGMGQGVMFRPGQPGGQQSGAGPADQRVVLCMNADQRAVLAGLCHDAQDLGIA